MLTRALDPMALNLVLTACSQWSEELQRMTGWRLTLLLPFGSLSQLDSLV